MNKYLDTLKSIKLFRGFDTDEISAMLECLAATPVFYRKNQYIILQGAKVLQVGIVIEGKAKIQKEDINGDVVTLSELCAGDTFCEDVVCAKILQSSISVWAVTQVTAVFLDYNKIISVCPKACSFHRRLITNMFEMIANKLILADQKIDILKKSTIRSKLLAFFEIFIEKTGSKHFTIPLNRNDLAEYIGANRSAMSRELCNMRDEGLIEFSGNEFHVK